MVFLSAFSVLLSVLLSTRLSVLFSVLLFVKFLCCVFAGLSVCLVSSATAGLSVVGFVAELVLGVFSLLGISFTGSFAEISFDFAGFARETSVAGSLDATVVSVEAEFVFCLVCLAGDSVLGTSGFFSGVL